MKNLNEKLGAKLDRTKLSAGADESDLLFEYKSEPIENLPYNILKAGENACKIITFCDKIGSTMRDVSCGLRGVMSDKTKGKSEENGSILNDLCGAEKNKSKSNFRVSKMSGSGKIGVQKSESEKNSGGSVKLLGGSVGLKEQIANGQSLCDAEEVERESVRRKVSGVSDSENFRSESEKSGSGRKNLRSNLNKDVGNGSYYKASHLKNDFSGSVTDEKENFQNVSVENGRGRAGREKCVKLSDTEKREIRELARLRVAEMQKMEEGVHPVFMRGATRVLSDKDKIRLENEYVKFGLRAKNENAEAGEEVNYGSESANQNGESVLVDASERNDVRFGKGESVELGNDINVVGNGEDTRLNNGSNIRIDNGESVELDNGEGVKLKSKCPIDFLGNGNKGVSYNSKQKNLDDGFSYVGSSLKGLDEYEQVSKCILCSPNVAYGESVDDEYAKNDLVSYGRLVFDNSDNVNKDLDGDLERVGKVSNKNLDGKTAGVGKLMSRSEEKIGANVKTSVDEKLGAGRVDNSGFESENVGKCKSNASEYESGESACGVSKSAVGNTTSVGEMVENSQVESFVDRDLELQEKSTRKKGKSKAYIVGAGDVNDCFPAGKFDNFDRKMVLNASVIGLDEEFIPMEVKNCELLNMRLDKRDVKFWGEKEWAKFFIKVDPCLNMCIDYCDRLVEKMVMLGGFTAESMAYGSAENMFNDMIDLIERKKMYLRLKKFVDRLKKELDAVDEKIIAYFVFGENTKDELLEIMSRRTVYRRASKIIKKLADFCVARGYTASWLYEKFGMVV